MALRILLAAAALVGVGSIMAPPLNAQSASQTGTFGTEIGTGRVICTGDNDGRGEGHEALDESYRRSAAWDARVFGTMDSVCKPDAPVFETVDSGVWERTASFTGQDSQGRTADLRLYVLDAQFTWAFGSSREIMQGTDPARFLYIFGRPMFLSEFCAGDAAVAIGAASFEGERELNARLARARAGTVGNEMQRLTQNCGQDTPPTLHYLNLGEFTAETACMRAGTCSGNDTAPQRRVVIIGIDDAEPGINLAEAVRDGLTSSTAMSVLSAADYERYEFGAIGETTTAGPVRVSAPVAPARSTNPSFVLVPGVNADARIGQSSGLDATVLAAGVRIAGPAGELGPSTRQLPNGVAFSLGEDIENAVSGKTIEVSIDASGGSFAVAYSTNEVGNSGWRTFDAAPWGTTNTFTYRVPAMAAGAGEFIGFRPTSSVPFVVSRISITVQP